MSWTKPSQQRKKPLLKKLMVYYGYPISIDGKWTVDGAVSVYEQYDIIVFGDRYQQPTHSQYTNTVSIISKLKQKKPSIEIFGYVAIGLAPVGDGLTIDQIKQYIDGWKTAGATGAMLDEFGYDFYVTRDRQNEIVEYCHSKGMNVMANSYDIAWTFSKSNLYLDWINHYGNPNLLEPKLNERDYFLIEQMFYAHSSGTQRGSSTGRVNIPRTFHNTAQSDYGGKTWAEKFGTKLIGLDEIEIKNQDYFNNGYIGSVLLKLYAYGASVLDWGASAPTFHHYSIPTIPYELGDKLGTIVANSYQGTSSAQLENTLGNTRLKLIWLPDPNDSKDPEKGTRIALINDEPVGRKYGSTLGRPKIAPIGFQYLDTTIGKPIWYNGSGWVDSGGATV